MPLILISNKNTNSDITNSIEPVSIVTILKSVNTVMINPNPKNTVTHPDAIMSKNTTPASNSIKGVDAKAINPPIITAR